MLRFFEQKKGKLFLVKGPGYTKRPLGHQVACLTFIKIIFEFKKSYTVINMKQRPALLISLDSNKNY